MDLYNRWKMRASGEAKHQAKTRAERVVFGIFDYMLTAKLISLEHVDEGIINIYMEKLLHIAEEYTSVKMSGIKPVEMMVFPIMNEFMSKDDVLFQGDVWITKQAEIKDIDFLEGLAEHIRRYNRD